MMMGTMKPWKIMTTFTKMRRRNKTHLKKREKTLWKTWMGMSNGINCISDYERKDELDRYEEEGIDDEEQRELNYEERQQVAARLD